MNKALLEIIGEQVAEGCGSGTATDLDGNKVSWEIIINELDRD